MGSGSFYQQLISGDGRYAFFAVRAGSNLMPAEAYSPGSQVLYLLRKDVNTGESKLVSRRPDGRTPAPVDPTRNFMASWDGSRVAYITLPDGVGYPYPEPPGINPDIDLIVNDPDHDDMWVVQDGTTERNPDGVGGLSGDGDVIVFTTFGPDPNVTGGQQLIRAERGGERHLIAQRIYEESADSTFLWGEGSMAADGETIVYVYLTWLADQRTHRWELIVYRHSPDKKYETSLVVMDGEPYENLHWPRISPDGTTLTFSATQGHNGPFTAFTKKVTAPGTWGTPVAHGEAYYAPGMTANVRYIGYATIGALGGLSDTVAGSITRPATGGSLSLTYDGGAGVTASNCLGQCEWGVWYQRYDMPGQRGNLHSCNTPDYGYIGEHERRTGMRVKLCFPMPKGTPASSGIKPPGFPDPNEYIPGTKEWRYARGHLLGAQLGGSGTEPRNLVTLYQLANREVMDPEEDKIRATVDDGEGLYYYVAPVYTDTPPPGGEQDLSKRMPDKMHLVASGDKGFFLDACIPNVEGGVVTYDDPCTA
jgi:hypothetical protein